MPKPLIVIDPLRGTTQPIFDGDARRRREELGDLLIFERPENEAEIDAALADAEILIVLNNYALIPGTEPKTVKVINMNTGKNPRSKGLLLSRSRTRKNLKFDKLIRDAIALLVQRGKIKIPAKKRRPSPPSGKNKAK